MKIKTISCKKIKNLGNYQSEAFEAFAEIGEDENEDLAALQLRRYVEDSLNRDLKNNKQEIDF